MHWKIIPAADGTFTIDISIFEDIFSSPKEWELYEFFKRMMDILGAIFAIAACMPIMLFIASLVKFISKGPVLFKQQRVGRFGKPFTFMKFRSIQIGSGDLIHKDYVTKLVRGKDTEINHSSKN